MFSSDGSVPIARQIQMLQTEFIGVFRRWYDESDLDELDMARAAQSATAIILSESTVGFESDMDDWVDSDSLEGSEDEDS